MTNVTDHEQGPDQRPWPADADVDWWRAVEETTDSDLSEPAPTSPAPSPGISPYAQPPRGARADPADGPPDVPARAPVTAPPAVLIPAAPVELATEADIQASMMDETAQLEPVLVPSPATPPASPSGAANGAPPGPATAARAVPARAVPAPRQPAGGRPASRPVRAPARRRARGVKPQIAVPALLVLLTIGTFVSGLSAEPFWLAIGHGHDGTATVVSAGNRCRATFVAADESFATSTVDLVNTDTAGCVIGAAVPARMVSSGATRAFASDTAGLRLRWLVGAGLLLLLGLLIAWATGSVRFRGWRWPVAVGASVAAPWMIAATILATTY
jgi:hypothetical protein